MLALHVFKYSYFNNYINYRKTSHRMKASNLIIIVLLFANLRISNSWLTFDQYCKQFNKTYSEQEYPIRQAYYNDRVRTFDLITEYTPGVNQMTDWSEEQIKNRKNLQQFPTEAQVGSQFPTKLSANKLGAPASLDWTSRNAVTSIKNQGSCGCCWAFSTIAYVESKLIIEGKYTMDNIDLSQQYMLKCTKSSDCGGGYLQYAIEQVRQVPTEQQYPYNPYGINLDICSAKGIKTGYTPYNYYSLSDSQLIDLLQNTPVPISVSSQGWQNYKTGVFKCLPGVTVDHAVLLVGYTDSYWLIKNQWGANWGEKGYIRVSRNISDNCKIGNSAHVLWNGNLLTSILMSVILLMTVML